MKKDLEDGKVTVNYFFCETECKFLDKVGISEYLTETRIENKSFLKSINKLCLEIIDLWNKDFQDLPDRKFDETFHSNTIIFSELYFHAIYLKEDKWQFFSTVSGKTEFTNNYDYSSIQIAEIAQRCSLILNWITSAYPETKPKGIDKNSKLKYSLDNDFFEKAREKHEFKSFQEQIKRNGFNGADFNGYKIKVYTAELTYLLFVDNYEAYNNITAANEKVNRSKFFDIYYNGFLEGEKFFITKYNYSTNILYGANGSEFIAEIHNKYLHNGKNLIQGWNYVKNSFPTTLTTDQIKEYGYYSGIVSKVDEMIKEHRSIFVKFDKCTHETQPKDVVNFKFKNNFDKVESSIVYSFFKENLVDKNHLSKEDLEKYLLLAFQNKEIPEKKFKLSNINIGNTRKIFYTYYKDIAGKPHSNEFTYAELLGNYFERFTTKKVFDNFAREY